MNLDYKIQGSSSLGRKPVPGIQYDVRWGKLNHLWVVFSMRSPLLNVEKVNLLEGKLSPNSAFLVLEQSCWFFHFSWQQILPIVCGKQAGCAASPAKVLCSVNSPASGANLVTPGNKQLLCLGKTRQQGRLALSLAHILGGFSLLPLKSFQKSGMWTCFVVSCPPSASPSASSSSLRSAWVKVSVSTLTSELSHLFCCECPRFYGSSC